MIEKINLNNILFLDIENSGIFLDKLYVTMSTTLKRSSFDLFWDVLENFGSSAVSNDIKVTINMEATLQNDLIFQHIKEKTKK